MKKFFILFACMTVAISSAFAKEELVFENVFDQTEYLIQHGMKKNKDEIFELSASLTDEEKQMLYDQNKKDLSIIKEIGNYWGAGSFSMGDGLGGSVVLFCELAGEFTVGVSAIAAIFPIISIVGMLAMDSDTIRTYYITCGIAGGAGLGVFLFGVIYSVIRPGKYVERYNTTLTNALSLDNAESVSFVPVVNPVKKEYGLAMEMKF